MPSATEIILARLEKLEFSVRPGASKLFGEPLPLVTGIAWDARTAQIVLVAEHTGKTDVRLWQQLLFAGSGIRHQLASDGPSAYGTPVILAVIDPEQEPEIRALAEDLVKSYAVFNRVDLNLVPRDSLAYPERLDDALAPLLPRCREILGKEISREEVRKFWGLLRAEIEAAASKLDRSFGSRRVSAGERGATALIGDSEESAETKAPWPISTLSLEHFRSAEKLEIELAAVSIINGPNGGGKSTIVEAMELGWAGTPQRRPSGVPAAVYEEHLPCDGDGSFSLTVDGKPFGGITEHPTAELTRCVLSHDAMSTLVKEEPTDRFSGLLEVTGLEIPDVKERTAGLIDSTKPSADEALEEAGMKTLKTRAANALDHLKGELKSEFLKRYSALPELSAIEKNLGLISRGTFAPRKSSQDLELRDLLREADGLIAESFGERGLNPRLPATLDRAGRATTELFTARSEMAVATRRLLHELQLMGSTGSTEPSSPAPPDHIDGPISVDLATRWLTHSQGVASSAKRFRREAEEIENERWAEQLSGYAEALEDAATATPEKELERWSRPRERPLAQRAPAELDRETYEAAGFSEPPLDAAILPPLRELSEALDDHVEELRKIETELQSHPAREFGDHADRLLDGLCDFELARVLRREGPIQEAGEKLITELLDERLAPVVRELVAAVVRFDWYFKPLLMSTDARAVVLAGLATERGDLDARMMLNSAEQTVVGLAWFLGLHMLQPKDRREVLVLDDPTAGFDKANQAGFTSTLRAFTRLLRPAQVVLTTHDDAVASMLAEEFAPADGWPDSRRRWRVQRDEHDRSVAIPQPTADSELKLAEESSRLGLLEDAPAVD